MNDIMTVAQETANRALRRKSFYFLLLGAIVIAASGQLYGELNAGAADLYTLDLGLAMVHLVALLSALFICFDLPNELRERTAVTVLTKPLGRDFYLVGKWLGVSMVAVTAVAISTAGLILVVNQSGGFRDATLIAKVGMLEALAAVELVALGALLALFLNEWLASFGVLVLLWLGHWIGAAAVAGGSGSADILGWLLPHGAMLHLPGVVAREESIAPLYLGGGALLALAYAGAVLSVASLIFRQKDVA